MRKSLKQFKDKLILIKGKVVSLDGQQLFLRNISIDGFFTGVMDMFFIPVPSNTINVCYEESIAIETTNLSQKLKIGNYVSILGKLYENDKGITEYSICNVRFVQKEKKSKMWNSIAQRAYCEQCTHFNRCSKFVFRIIQKARNDKILPNINKTYYLRPLYEITYKKEGAYALRSLCELYPAEFKNRENFINNYICLLQTLDDAEAQKQKNSGCALTDEECKNISLDDVKWKNFKKRYKNYNAVINSEWGYVDFNFDSAKYVKNGNFKNKDEYLDAQRNKNSREWFSMCYHGGYPASFIGRIEKFSKNKDKVLFERIRVCGSYMDGTYFKGKEDHVWMEAKEFKKYKPDDCVSFYANVYRYLRTKDNVIDYGLCNPQFIEQVEKYRIPTDEELQEQDIEQIVCETCLYNKHCYMGNCINPEYKKLRMEELKNFSQNNNNDMGINPSLFTELLL